MMKLNNMYEEEYAPVIIHKSGKHFKFKDRSLSSKIQRVIYNIFFGIYSSIFFYFIPYIFLIVTIWSKFD